MQDLRTKRHVVFLFHLHLVFIYILVYILALLLEMSKSLSRLLSGTSPGIYANYYKISIYLKKNFMSLYPAPEESWFYGHVDKVDNIIIWGIISKDIPRLREQIDKLIK